MKINTDFLRLASTPFLARLFEQCCADRNKTTKAIEAYCAVELSDRAEKLDHATYEVAMRIHKSERFAYIVPGLGMTQLVALNPGVPKVPKLPRHLKKEDASSSD